MLENVVPVTTEMLAGESAKIKYEGYKFITMSCVEKDASHVDIIYHFDRELKLKHFRLTVPKDTVVPSISHVYLAAFLVENEIQDLFKVCFSGLAIDFNRTLYLEEDVKEVPFCRCTHAETDTPDSDATETP